MLPLSSILTAAATGEVDLQQLLPTILIVVCGIVLLIAFFVGFAKGWRRVSWAGCVWLVACLAFFLLQGGIGEAFAQTLAPILAGLSLDGSVAAFAAAFVLALGCIIVALLLYGIFSLIFRPRMSSIYPNEERFTRDEDGFEYDEEYLDYDDYEDYQEREMPYRKGYGTPSFLGRLTGALLCIINVAAVLATVFAVAVLLLGSTPLKDGGLQPFFQMQIMQSVLPLLAKYAMDVFVIGILVAFACKGRRTGFIESVRVLIVNIGTIVAIIACFYLPFSQFALPPDQGGVELLYGYVSKCQEALISLVPGQIGMIVGSLMAGLLLAIIVGIVMAVLNWILKSLVNAVEGIGFFRVIDGSLAVLVYLVIGTVVCALIWSFLLVLSRYQIVKAGDFFSQEAVLSNGLFDTVKAFVEPLLVQFEEMIKGFVGGLVPAV